MKYAISVIPESEGSNDVSLSLDTTEGTVEIKSYGVILNLQEFIEFADGVQEIRRKLEVLTLKNNKGNDTTGNRNHQDEQKFAMGVCMQHRTLQQNIMRSFVATIRHMASENYGYDLRNQSSHNAAKKMVESGLLDEIYLPFI